MSEPPKVKELVFKHEKPKNIFNLESQIRQKPKAKFRDSFLPYTSDEGLLYPAFERNRFTEPNSIKLRSIIKTPKDDQNNETIIKSKSQSKIFKSKNVMRSDGSGNVSVTQDCLKDGVMCSVNDQKSSSRKLATTRTSYTTTTYRQRSFGDSDATRKVMPKVTVAAIGEHSIGVTKITDEFNSSLNHIDGNEMAERSRTISNDKFENIRKRYNCRERFDRDSNIRRLCKEKTNKTAEKRPQSTLGLSLMIREDLNKALQHKFEQTTVSCSLKHKRSAKPTADSSRSTKRIEKRTVTTTTTELQDDVSTEKRIACLSFTDVVILANIDGESSESICNVSQRPNATAVQDDDDNLSEQMSQKVVDQPRRSSVIELLTKFQTNVKPSTPTNSSRLMPTSTKHGRYTTSVSFDELQNIRMWQQENGYVEFRPSETKTACSNKHFLRALLRQTGSEDEMAWNSLAGKLQENQGDNAKVPMVEFNEDTFENLFKESTKSDDVEIMEHAFECLFTETMKNGKK